MNMKYAILVISDKISHYGILGILIIKRKLNKDVLIIKRKLNKDVLILLVEK
jgi:hypothetical protein